MLKNYLKIAWRNLVRNKTASLINISGLAVGLAVGVLVLLFVMEDFSYDKFHRQLPQIYQLMKTDKISGETLTSKSVPGPLAAALRNDIPEIKYIARESYGSQHLLSTTDKSFYSKGMYADPDLFRIMSFPTVAGDPVTALQNAGSVVITESIAMKLFGTTDAVGKSLTHDNQHHLQVGAVIGDIPTNSTEQFEIVLPILLMQQDNPWINKWSDNALMTWILVQPNTHITALNAKLNNLLPARTGNTSDGLFAYPLADLHLKGSFNRQGKPGAGRLEAILLLIITGLFVLLIACINFMNLATAQSEKRSREVGVRKVMGAFRRQVIFQFLVEALLVAFFAMLVGIALALVALPILNGFAQSDIRFSINDWKIWAALLGLIVFTGLVAGSYPAFYLSSFKPVRILRGAIFKRKGGSWLRKGLVTFQFVLSIFLIVATIVIFKQLEYAQDRPVGYAQENLVEIPVRGDMGAKFDIIKNELLGLPGITSVSSGSNNLVQFGSSSSDINWPGKPADQQFQFVLTNVNYDWVKTTGMKLAEGRDFASTFGTDTTAVIINQSAAQKMGLKTPIAGTKINNSTVIGVLEDFVFNSVYEAPRPMLIFLSKTNVSHIFIRIRNNDQWRSTMKQVESILKSNNPNYPFEYHFTSEEYQKRFTGVKYMSQLVTGVGIMAIFISCLGLFGLAGFLAERRTKEIGVRKVLGAKVMQLWLMLSKDFLKPVAVAFLIAAPLSGWIMQQMLVNWEYHTTLSWWIFAVAGLLAFFIAVCTVSFHGIKAAFTNPAKSLRTQ